MSVIVATTSAMTAPHRDGARAPQKAIVLDEEELARGDRRAHAATGSENPNVAPIPASDSHHTRPPKRSTINRTR
jgi:hypothetical protein